MQQLFPLAIRGVLHKDVCAVIVELCSFFKQLCSKVLKIDQLEHLENDIIVTLCKLERIFPPSFCDVMVHLPIHLASEAKVVGPVQYRWMYLRTLKSYVRNKSRPESSIAEGEHKQSIRVKPRIRARDVDLIHTREFISWFEEREMSHRRGRVQIVSLEDELDNLQQLSNIQPAVTTTPSSSDPSDSSNPSVVEKYELEETCKSYILQCCGNLFRSYRSKMKAKYYNPYNTYEERLCHRPPHLSDDDWSGSSTLGYTGGQDQFQQLLSQPEGTSSSTSASSGASTSVAFTYVDEIYTQVMGPETWSCSRVWIWSYSYLNLWFY
ncbi:hypothetical protein CK203_039720 [Vitis vinifera]|uniref:DUF4218 domain-containing protein n=1 Tax=Vitis vinifera TaxID=29760 RepID=A0A438HU41_VITVI|nr:hypothetical protein CK203_039720 [Vitis vinifera]